MDEDAGGMKTLTRQRTLLLTKVFAIASAVLAPSFVRGETEGAPALSVKISLVAYNERADAWSQTHVAFRIEHPRDISGTRTNTFQKYEKRVLGVQGGFVNSADRLNGNQFGFRNYARNARGMQVGFINYATQMDGIQIGFLNFNRGRIRSGLTASWRW